MSPSADSCRRKARDGFIDESVTCPPTINLNKAPIKRPTKAGLKESQQLLNQHLLKLAVPEITSIKEEVCDSDEESISSAEEKGVIEQDLDEESDNSKVPEMLTEYQENRRKSRRKLRSRYKRYSRYEDLLSMDSMSDVRSMNSSISFMTNGAVSTVSKAFRRYRANRFMYMIGAFLFIAGWALAGAYKSATFTISYGGDSSLRRRVTRVDDGVARRTTAELDMAQVQQDIIQATIANNKKF